MQAGDVAPLGRARLSSTLSELVKFWGGGWESQETLGLGRWGLRQGVMLWLRESKGTIVFPGGVTSQNFLSGLVFSAKELITNYQDFSS